MINFRNDYGYIAHEAILEKMLELKDECNVGYGLDIHSENAKKLIKTKLENENVDIHFLVGGTITNKTVIDHVLRPYEAVIACDSGHINVHETGAIESVGHKVLTVKNIEGKITKEAIKEIINSHVDEHMVLPKMVYISNATELGSIYNKKELEDIYKYCKEMELYLFIDGARLAIALTSEENDLELKDLPNLCDVFYIGGTKNGAMLGEAVVIVNDKLKENFRFSTKQNGGMYSKGFVAGIQFEVLFTDNLFLDLGYQANKCAQILRNGLKGLNIGSPYRSSTNQVFVELDNVVIEELNDLISFEIWERKENKTIIRLVTSFATKESEINDFLSELAKIIARNR